jgi:hypothetical protein
MKKPSSCWLALLAVLLGVVQARLDLEWNCPKTEAEGLTHAMTAHSTGDGSYLVIVESTSTCVAIGLFGDTIYCIELEDGPDGWTEKAITTNQALISKPVERVNDFMIDGTLCKTFFVVENSIVFFVVFWLIKHSSWRCWKRAIIFVVCCLLINRRARERANFPHTQSFCQRCHQKEFRNIVEWIVQVGKSICRRLWSKTNFVVEFFIFQSLSSEIRASHARNIRNNRVQNADGFGISS